VRPAWAEPGVSMTAVDRRRFLQGGAAAVGAAALAGPFQGFLASPAAASHASTYGALGPVPDERDGVVRLDLPAGFRYRTFHAPGEVLSDGTPVPARGDGMAAFRGPRGWYRLVRNHEINGPGTAFGPIDRAYDPMTMGGCVSILVTGRGQVLHSRVALNGTQMNCAGGPTPWGSWLSCEETVNGDDVGSDFTGAPNTGLKQHGYVFEVPADGVSNGQPIKSAGRFAHEAAAVDPRTGIVYLTEDNFGFPSGFYRYLAPQHPMRAKRLRDGGKLQMLKVKFVANADLSGPGTVGQRLRVEWVDIPDPDPTHAPGTTNDQAIVAVGDQGRAAGAAIFSRLEGCTYDKGVIYFTSTQGGATNPADPPLSGGFGTGRGQVWAYDPKRERLWLVYESPGADTLDLPDNVTQSRNGTLVLCEDGSGDNFLRGLTRDGRLFDFARNADPAQAGQEFAGSTFSPDHKTLFVNIQSSSGYSMAIWGPWARGPFG
jgi:uncharacterized protein